MSEAPRKLVILGSTGSIGKQTLEVVDRHPDRFKVVGLAARDEIDELALQAEKYHPSMVAIGETGCYQPLKNRIGGACQVVAGMEGMCELADRDDVDIVVVAVSGSIGILPTLAAIRRSRRIALANKETLVAAGDIVMSLAQEHNAPIIPVDSEHSAIFQCLAGEVAHLRNIWLTASGGPFRDFTQAELTRVTVDMALRHPNWKMGPKITVDSATLMNKGLEVIEAHHLFGVSYDRIKVVIQKESVIHSMVELADGAFLGHLGVADMRIPIQYALSYPDRLPSPAPSLDFSQIGAIHFQQPDLQRFPLLGVAYEAGRVGGTLPAVMNAANEEAVHKFLAGQIGFLDIARLVVKVMEAHSPVAQPRLDDIFAMDGWARVYCREMAEKGLSK
ncbi:MAG TPA: 1-deoxy-D-xylulose-5-phosphate reductoisomerase [Syntrophomonadaceae bacterium]|nr:1-deoxy-D-xylulose-5-phosphate reductoisomerase [Syntrophomonadaceae bacterium]